jgi:cell division protein ZapD
LPTLHVWLHLPQAQRDEQVNIWLSSLTPLNHTLSLILDLIRNSAPFRKQTSLNGFYQDNGEDADLLRLHLDLDSQLFPQISGIKVVSPFVSCRSTAKMASSRNAWISNWLVVKEK